ncbi:hypothetical protein AGABI1DRAFT_124706 [Agaricus bisporus var. burnettii JB137-S8]|uniref:F-box domain-containing protein n=1 Tax=Agaricus bisporus var. burnettii (strain JB137-S8 / ATCC MYA-4627 / FGSC 10392) TaxID=597362 RepID=K5X8Y0_AGABU|nr:uncharacterized protein AGABI1DRAFT_124706 [Agaricus bisporus var. burnettii JB137-S8]EKM84396.1 hypothetical protein AGABI1DRAFT_124706 [Agaricus bisporus var. burnettii JB137-S8]
MDTSQRKSKIDDIHQKIRRVDEAVAELAKERQKLLEELNNVQSAVSALPPEILCHVFYFARPSHSDTFYAPERIRLFCNLQLVSKHWRQILLSNPVIWTEIDLCIAPVNPRRNARSLLAFITHSRQLPLSVDITYISSNGFDDGTLIHPSVDPLLLRTLGRVSRLRLYNPPVAWFSHLALLKQTTHLTLTNVNVTVLPLPLDQFASLSNVTVRGRSHIRFTAAHAITTLTLGSMPISSSFHIFTSCPNLKNLHLSCESHDRKPGFPVDSFTLPHLEMLHWKLDIGSFDSWYKAILNHIHLPSLRTLEWDEGERMTDDTCRKAVTRFFASLPMNLTSLKLHKMWRDSRVHNEVIQDVLQMPPMDSHLESITFINCSIPYFRFFLRKLRSPHQFPRLHTIEKDGRSWTPNPRTLDSIFQIEEDFSQSCLAMLRNRMNVSNRRFTLRVDEVDRGWLDKVEKGMLEITQSISYPVEILRTGCKIVLNT